MVFGMLLGLLMNSIFISSHLINIQENESYFGDIVKQHKKKKKAPKFHIALCLDT